MALHAAHSGSRSPGEPPRLAVTMGDPLGIGPEVVVKALADRDLRKRARFHIYGFAKAMHLAADRAGIDPFWWQAPARSTAAANADAHDVLLINYEPTDRDSAPAEPGADLDTCTSGRPTRAGGLASFRFVEDAIEAARLAPEAPMHVDGIVTAPISKEAWAMAGKSKYPGHTDLLSVRLGAKRTRMMFVSDKLNTILATAHIPLMDIRNVLTIGLVYDTIDLGHQACEMMGYDRPRIAVCGLNPHAGEGGLLGDEETRLIEPAIRLAQQQGMRVSGPFPGDTIFRKALAREFDLVVAMYHDQGLIPIKTLAFDSAVNATIGLPTVRTSPDHGTAYDIAGQNAADPGSMKAAIDLAIRLVSSHASAARAVNAARA